MPFYNANAPVFVPSTASTSLGLGNGALSNDTTGGGNLALGSGAGDNITSGANNTIVGVQVATSTLATGSNNILIGTNGSALDTASASTSNTFAIAGGATAIISATSINSTPAVTIPGSLTVTGNMSAAFTIGSSADGITAHSGGGSGSATQLTASLNRVSTTAADHDSVKLPGAIGGMEIAVDNDGAKVLDIYPSGSDTIEDGAGPISILSGADISIVCPVSGKWYLQGSSPTAIIPAASAITVASYMNGSTILLNTASGSVVTLPAATGSGNLYKFVVTTTASSNAHKILAASSSDFINGVVVGHVSAGTTLTFSAAAATAHSIQMPFAGTQPSGGFIGDWFEFTDVAANLWAVKGMYQSGTTSTTPFSAATT